MTLPVLHPRPGNLREVAEQIEASTGLRVEIIGGSLVMSPTPRGKHAGTIRVDGQPIPHPERHEMGQGDTDAATVEDLGTVTARRDPQGSRGSRAAR